MRIAIAVAISLLLADRPIRAQLSESEQSKFINELHNSLGLSDSVKRVVDGKIDNSKIRVIAAILRNSNEIEIHRMRGSRNNTVFLHPNGHQEAVYDGNHLLVQDGMNDGSYNYFHPQKDALRHFTFDIAPWLLFGQSRNDPTTRSERVHAYSTDLYRGMSRALAAPRTDGKLDDVNLQEPGSAEAIAIFLIAIERANAEEMVRVVNLQEKQSDREILALVRKIERGLQTLFAAEVQVPVTRE